MGQIELQIEPGKKLEILPLPVHLDSKALGRHGKVNSGDRRIWGQYNIAGLKRNLFPVDGHVKGTVGEAIDTPRGQELSRLCDLLRKTTMVKMRSSAFVVMTDIPVM